VGGLSGVDDSKASAWLDHLDTPRPAGRVDGQF
jgi:hypothetical protein